MSRTYTVYFETPRVHFDDWAHIKARIETLCREHGLVPRLPAESMFYGTTAGREASRRIAQLNTAALDDAEALIVDLDTFRGPSIATRVAWAIGSAGARGLPIHGYTTDQKSYFLRYRRYARAGNAFIRDVTVGPGGDIVGLDNGVVDTFGAFDAPAVAEAVSEHHPSLADAVEAVARHFHG